MICFCYLTKEFEDSPLFLDFTAFCIMLFKILLRKEELTFII